MILRRCAALCGFSAAALVLSGQTVSTTAGASHAPDDDLVVMSPFEVSVGKDVGYTAASSLAGGRTDMPLKDTPAAISVMTREFIDDLAGTSFHDLAEWSVNSVPEYNRNESPFGDYSIQLRGLGGSYPSRNYFLWYVDGDGYNNERFEMARGPNGVLSATATSAVSPPRRRNAPASTARLSTSPCAPTPMAAPALP